MTEPSDVAPAGERGSGLYRVSIAFLRLLYRLYNRWEVSGREHVPDRGGVLLFANHTSYADPPIVGPACPRAVNFMAKSELFRLPVLAPFIRRTHAFPVQRGTADQRALRHALQLLKDGEVLLIFPEGTRSPDGRLLPFEAGAAFVALASGAAVVPVGLEGADRLLPRGVPLLLPGKLRVAFGPPVELSDLRQQRRSREVLQETCDRMQAALADLLPPERLPSDAESS
jgi:1-acyl-sn-glycerol-3-phosphate acyltransferase